jgi:hypothetical protein
VIRSASRQDAAQAAIIVVEILKMRDRVQQPWQTPLSSETIRMVWQVMLQNASDSIHLLPGLAAMAAPTDRAWMWDYLVGRQITTRTAHQHPVSLSPTATTPARIMSADEIVAFIRETDPQQRKKILPTYNVSEPPRTWAEHPSRSDAGATTWVGELVSLCGMTDPTIVSRIQATHNLVHGDIIRWIPMLLSLLLPDQMSAIGDLLRLDDGKVVHGLEQWMRHADPHQRQQVLDQLIRWVLDDDPSCVLPLRTQIDLLHLIVSLDPRAIPYHRCCAILEQAWQTIPDHRVMSALRLLMNMLREQRVSQVPPVVYELLTKGESLDVRKEAATVLFEHARRMRSVGVTVDVLRAVAETLLPGDSLDAVSSVTLVWFFHHARDIPGALFVIGPLIREFADHIDTMPDDVVESLASRVWSSQYREELQYLVAAMIRKRPHPSLAMLVQQLWGCGDDDYLLTMIETHAAESDREIWVRVLSGGIFSSVGERVCACISRLDPQNAHWVIMDEIERQINAESPLAMRCPPYLLPWIRRAVREDPWLGGSPNIMRWLWEVTPHDAMVITRSFLGHADDDGCRMGTLMVAYGWGRGMDDAIRHVLDQTLDALDRPSEPDTMRDRDKRDAMRETVLETILAGVGHTDSSKLMDVLMRLLPALSSNQYATLVRCLAERGQRDGTDMLRTILPALVDLAPPASVVAVLEALGNGRWHESTAPVIVTTAQALIDRFMRHTPADVTYQDACMLEAVGNIMRRGWTYDEPRRMTMLVDRVVTWMTSVDLPKDHPMMHAVSAWASVLATGSSVLSESDLHRLVHPLFRISEDGVWDGLKEGCLSIPIRRRY